MSEENLKLILIFEPVNFNNKYILICFNNNYII
jgi:hypothetical protein